MNRGPATKRTQRKHLILKRDVGCLACILDGNAEPLENPEPADFHHAPNPPKGVHPHDWGYPLCPWHHRGIIEKPEAGPSLARSKAVFQDWYGSDSYLVKMGMSEFLKIERATVR